MSKQTPKLLPCREEVARAIYFSQRGRLIDQGSVTAQRPWRDENIPNTFWNHFLADADAVLALTRPTPAERPSDAAVADEAYGYAKRLLEHFVAEHFPSNPDWKALPDLIGVLTQIDNVITIIRDFKEQAQQYKKMLALPPDESARALMQRCMDMLADVPGATLEDKLTKYIGEYMALQIRAQARVTPSTVGKRTACSVDRYDALPQHLRDQIMELEIFIGDVDGHELDDGGTVDASDAVNALNKIIAAMSPSSLPR